MKNILVIGATGQIGSELTMELRKRYGNTHVVAGYIHGAEPKGELKESGPSAVVDVTDQDMIASVVREYNIDTIYNLAALLSVVAESKPKLAWKIGIDGLWNVLEVARENKCAVFTPSSIGSFGESTPHVQTPQDTIQRPRTMYGISKVTTELLSDYYFNKYGVDTRAVRYAAELNSFDYLAITRLDILDDMEEIKVCTGYEYEGKEIEEYPADLKFLEKITPVYETFKGWKQKISDIRSYDELPALCKEYLEGISKLIGVPIGIVSVGPSREQTIVIKEVF